MLDKNVSLYITSGHPQVFIHYLKELDGGGTRVSKYFIKILNKYYPNIHFKNCLEWCSGPGFIGFEILSNNICSDISFMDKYQPALDSILETINVNNLNKNIKIYNASKISDIQLEKYNLIVGNPPWQKSMPVGIKSQDLQYVRRNIDENLLIHNEFFVNVDKLLVDNGVVIIAAATYKYTCVDKSDFKNMIKNTSLKLIDFYFPDTEVGEREYSYTYYAIFQKINL